MAKKKIIVVFTSIIILSLFYYLFVPLAKKNITKLGLLDFPKKTFTYYEVFNIRSLSKISRNYTFFTKGKKPVPTFKMGKNTSILIYMLSEKSVDKSWNEILDVKVGNSITSGNVIFHEIVDNKYFVFYNSFNKPPVGEKTTISIDGELLVKPIITDSSLFYRFKLKKLVGTCGIDNNIMFYGEKKHNLFYPDTPIQLLFKKKRGNVYMIILYPNNSIDPKLSPNCLMELF